MDIRIAHEVLIVNTVATKMYSAVDLMNFCDRNHCISILTQFLRGQGWRTKGTETSPSIALCSTCPAGYMTRHCYCICCMPHCCPPPFELWLHLPHIQRSVTLNHLAPTGIFGEAGASLRHSDQERRMLPTRVQAKFSVMILLCAVSIIIENTTSQIPGKDQSGCSAWNSGWFW